jgi:hypothetical protein
MNTKSTNGALASAFFAVGRKYTTVPVEEVKIGTIVQRTTVCKACRGTDDYCSGCDSSGFLVQMKFYKRGVYDKSSKRYSLEDMDDTSREVFVKKGTPLFLDGTY